VEEERDRRAGLAHRWKELGYATSESWVFKDPTIEAEEYVYTAY
jgi:hypothetical protein